GPPWHAALIDEVQDEIDSAQKEADERDADTDDGYQLQRQRAEIEDVVEGGPHEAQQAVPRSAVLARVVAYRDVFDAPGAAENERADDRVAGVIGQQGIHQRARETPIGGHYQVRWLVEYPGIDCADEEAAQVAGCRVLLFSI